METAIITIFVAVLIAFILGAIAHGKRKECDDVKCNHSHWDKDQCRACGKKYSDDNN